MVLPHIPIPGALSRVPAHLAPLDGRLWPEPPVRHTHPLLTHHFVLCRARDWHELYETLGIQDQGATWQIQAATWLRFWHGHGLVSILLPRKYQRWSHRAPGTQSRFRLGLSSWVLELVL